MANGVYEAFLQSLGEAGIDLSTGTFKIALVDTGVYTVNLATHQYESDLSGVLDETNLVNPSWSGRVFDADDFSGTFPDSGGGGTGEALVIYKDTGTPTTSQLMFYFDSVTGLPITQDGTADTIVFDAAGIWQLGS